MSEWISVEDRLPEEWGRYLTTNGKAITIHEYNREIGFYHLSSCFGLSHWMRLPEPPTTKQEKG